MNEDARLTERFEAERPRLRAVAYRMLGSSAEADDAVQEAWLRLSRADTGGVENLTAWLTTVVARLCLNTLRSRRSSAAGTSRHSSRCPDRPAAGTLSATSGLRHAINLPLIIDDFSY
jgi:RNA polymerase sigma factor (sigma-70 family)